MLFNFSYLLECLNVYVLFLLVTQLSVCHNMYLSLRCTILNSGLVYDTRKLNIGIYQAIHWRVLYLHLLAVWHVCAFCKFNLLWLFGIIIFFLFYVVRKLDTFMIVYLGVIWVRNLSTNFFSGEIPDFGALSTFGNKSWVALSITWPNF